MHNIVGARKGQSRRKINFFQPRHSPLQEHRTLRKVHSTFSLACASMENVYMKTVFPFSLFFVCLPHQEKSSQTPPIFTFSQHFSPVYYRNICLLILHCNTLGLNHFGKERNLRKRQLFSSLFSLLVFLPSENESFSFVIKFCCCC